MRLLLDTSALLWFWLGGNKMSATARGAMQNQDAEIYVSAISPMEIATKHRIGKLPGVENVLSGFDLALQSDGFRALEFRNDHALLAGSIISEHRDPFDRMLAAQARIEKLVIVSPDTAFDALGARRLW